MAIGVPPHVASYSSQLAEVPKEPPTTIKVDVCVEHRPDGVAVKEVGATELVLTLTVTDAQAVVLQAPLARM